MPAVQKPKNLDTMSITDNINSEAAKLADQAFKLVQGYKFAY